MMDIPIKAEVYCRDGLCGHTTQVILNPTTDKVTHLVIAERGLFNIEHIVPLEQVTETTPNTVQLRCSAQELTEFDPFVEAEFISGDDGYGPYAAGQWMLWPYALPEGGALPVLEHENIPPGELAVRRGTPVKATDGRIGRVDEFLIDPTNGNVTHLVLREGYLWGQKEVTIPVAQIDKIEDDVVQLKLDKRSVEALPHIPVRRMRVMA